MSWKIITGSKRCDYKSIRDICHHVDFYNEECSENECPIKVEEE